MANNILVIGNGYDLAHGLRTSYNDFIEWVRQINGHYSSLVSYSDDDFCERLKENGFIGYFLNYTKEVSGWVDLERLIRKVTDYFELFFSNYTDFIDNERNITWDSNNADISDHWKIGAVNCLYMFPLFDQDYSRENRSYYCKRLDKRYYTDVFGLNKREILKLLKCQLDDVIQLLRIYLKFAVDDGGDIAKKAQISSINPKYVISFNYTDTYRIYSIKKEDVFHVHGSLIKNNMVLGFDDDDPDNLDFVYFKKYFQRIQKLTGYIDDSKIGAIYEAGYQYSPVVHFYGHSMDKTDGDIILKLRAMSSGFVIYTYNQDDYEQKVINLIDVFGKEQAMQLIQTEWIKFVPCES